MPKFPVDATREQVIKTLQAPGFELIREGAHVAMMRKNSDGASTPLT